MSTRLLIFLFLTNILLLIKEAHCAPKLGGMMFEQLLLESLIDDENGTNAYNKEKLVFLAPNDHDTIKNTTSLYAKLTGKSKRNPENYESEDTKSKKSEEIPAVDFSSTNTWKISMTITSNASFMPNLVSLTTTKNAKVNSEISKDNKFPLSSTRKSKTDLHKSQKPKNANARSVVEKTRRDGAVLQSNGYAFNERICQMRGDRVLCGYNNPKTSTAEPVPTTTVDNWADKDCILRGDRIECGYTNANYRRNQQQRAKVTESTVLALRNQTTYNLTSVHTDHANLTTLNFISVHTAHANLTTFNLTTVNTSSNSTAIKTSPSSFRVNTNDAPNLSISEMLKFIEILQKNINSTVTHSTTTSSNSNTKTKVQPNLLELRILKLIERVDKLLVSTDSDTTVIENTATKGTKEARLKKEIPPEAHELKKYQVEKLKATANAMTTTRTSSTSSSIPSTNSATSTTTLTSSSTSTSTITPTSTSTSTSTAGPFPYIDEDEYCVEKDDRIICYNDTLEDYDYLEK